MEMATGALSTAEKLGKLFLLLHYMEKENIDVFWSVVKEVKQELSVETPQRTAENNYWKGKILNKIYFKFN